MGLGKWIGGALLAVGTVVAAPIVVPALGATAIGGAITGAATAAGAAITSTAVGGAVAGAATAVGTTVAGAATAAGAAITSTAVGSAVVGTATTVAAGVGTAVGSAAGAVGLTSVAAVTGTTAGAAALGTITTTGVVGAASAASGAAKLSEAKDIKNEAIYRYNAKKEEFDKTQKTTNNTLESLGKEKVKVWSSFDRFVAMYSKIQNPPIMNGTVEKESLSMTADDLDNIRAVSISVKELLSCGAGSVGAGGFIGMATSGGLMSSITVASTGTAMTSLSGAAATNATLAAFGGGSLAAGGAGMAGGAAVLGGLTFAPMLMVGGLALNSKGKKSLETAQDIDKESRKAVEQMDVAQRELNRVRHLSNQIRLELGHLNVKYSVLMDKMEQLVAQKCDYAKFSTDERKCLEKTVLVLKLIKQVSMQNILDSKHENAVLEDEVKNVLDYSERIRKNELVA